MIVSGLSLLLSVPLWAAFKTGTAAMQFVERSPWISTIHAEYYLGVDGISMPLILLTTFTTVLIVIASWTNIEKRVAQYFAAFLILEGLMIGVFAAMDGALFYVFWEAMLIPMFIIIGVWGGPRRVYATIKFFLYTFIGSLLMLVALIYMYLKSGSYELAVFQRMPLTLTEQTFIFLAFFAAFAVKVPMWPVHTWLPDAHVEAPTGGSVVLAAIMLKMGGYGFLRFSLPIAPGCQPRAGLADHCAVVDRRGVHRLRRPGAAGHEEADRLFVDRPHGLRHARHVHRFSDRRPYGAEPAASNWASTAPWCKCCRMAWCRARCSCASGVMYDRVHSREISAYGGVINTMPKFAAFMVLFALANSGLPGTSGFIGEFMVILASFKANVWYAFLAATILVLGAAYTLWLVKRVIYGEVANDKVAALKDLNGREFLVLGALAAAVLLVGLWPAPLLDVMRASTQHLAQQLLASKILP